MSLLFPLIRIIPLDITVMPGKLHFAKCIDNEVNMVGELYSSWSRFWHLQLA